MRVAFGAPPCLLRPRRPRRRSRRSRRRSRSGRPPRTEGLGPPLFSPSRPFRRSARAFRRVRAASNARGRGWDASPRRDEVVSVCPYARPYAHFSPKSARGSHHIFRRCCTRFGADEADEEKMNLKTLDFPHPSSCSNFPNSNVIVDTMTPPNVGLKRASYQIFRRSGFREICVGVRTRQVVSIPRDDKGNCQRVFLTAKNHDPPANKDRIAACLDGNFWISFFGRSEAEITAGFGCAR